MSSAEVKEFSVFIHSSFIREGAFSEQLQITASVPGSLVMHHLYTILHRQAGLGPDTQESPQPTFLGQRK